MEKFKKGDFIAENYQNGLEVDKIGKKYILFKVYKWIKEKDDEKWKWQGYYWQDRKENWI